MLRQRLPSVFRARRLDPAEARAAFASLLREALEKGVGNAGRRWTQEGFAASVGVGKDAVANWVNGRALPNELSLDLVIKVLNVDNAEPWERDIRARLKDSWRDAQRPPPNPAWLPRPGWLKHMGVVLAAVITAAATIAATALMMTGNEPPRTPEYLARFEDSSSPVGQARNRITERLWQLQPLIAKLNEELADPSSAPSASVVRERLIGMLVHGDGTHPPLEPDIREVLAFYDQVANCISAGLCDDEATRTMLSDYAYTFWVNWSSFINARRDLQSSYGEGLETIANLSGKTVSN